MTYESMALKVVLPFEILLEKKDVKRLVVETTHGYMGFLPSRLDCVAFVLPGIIVYEAEGEEEKYIAADEGILVKTGEIVTISVRNAAMGVDVEQLQKKVKEGFLKRESTEKEVIRLLGRLESVFMQQVIKGARRG
jgi:F-type H+-transporting ATPase subunit epsilon